MCCLVAGVLALLVASRPPSLIQQATLIVEVAAGSRPVEGAAVVAGDRSATTDQNGHVSFLLPAGTVTIAVTREDFLPATATVDLIAGAERRVVVELEPQPRLEESVTVSATRTGKRLEDQPMRVEVLGREEIEEKMLMTPGDIVMMLNEMGGMRVQATSPSLAAASVRIQGMRGRHTRFLSDGLPLYGQQVSGLGLLQIPPMDLAQVEVIKGVASALYGAGAMGGVVDLVSRPPGDEPERQLLLNASTLGAADAVLWLSSPLSGRWGATLLAGGHRQGDADVDDDGWADLPGYARGVIRPRVFWDGGDGRSFFATAGVTVEDRTGGTVDGAGLPGTGQAYQEALDTRRFDAGAVAQSILGGAFVVTARAAVSRQHHDHRFGDRGERDRHTTMFGEVAVRGTAGRHTWVAGAALEHDDYNPLDVPGFAHTHTVPGLFLQDDVEVRPWFSMSASGRLDAHNEYGTFLSPRVSGLFRAGPWNARVSAGTGFFAPTALTEETEAAGLSLLSIPRPLLAERGRSASIDVTRTQGPASYTVTFFASRIRNPVAVFRDSVFELINLREATTNTGLEGIVTLRREPVALTATYTFVRSRELSEDGRRLDAALTPRHSAGVVGMIEAEDTGRVGLEIYVTGRQRLEVNPFRQTSASYVIVGLLAERRLGRLRVFVNGENLTGTRQTRWNPLLRPSQSADGRWTVDVWAPLEGRVVNGGIRFEF